MIVLPPHSAMEWDALMKALDENGDGTIEYKELFDAIWEDKREFSRGVGAKPTVTYEKDPVADVLPQVASVVYDLRWISVRPSSHASIPCPSIIHRFEGDQIGQRNLKAEVWMAFCP